MALSRLIDTHAHLCDDRFDPDRQSVIERAFAAGVVGIILIGETIADAHFNLELAKHEPRLHLAAGLYPGNADLEKIAEIIAFIKENQKQIIAIGEVGLDFQLAREANQRELQTQVLRQFVGLSLQTNLPINVHSRSAAKETVELLLATGAKNVQMHAYHGKHSVALQGVEAGFYFSVPTSIVRSQQIREWVEKVPLEKLLLESDSPVLGPETGQRNQPANIALSVPIIAQIKNLSTQEVAEQLFSNTVQLYGNHFFSGS